MFSASHHYVLAQEELPILSKRSSVPAVDGNASSELLMTTFTLLTYKSPAASHPTPEDGDTEVADLSVSPDHAMRSHNIKGNCSPVTSHETIC